MAFLRVRWPILTLLVASLFINVALVYLIHSSSGIAFDVDHALPPAWGQLLHLVEDTTASLDAHAHSKLPPPPRSPSRPPPESTQPAVSPPHPTETPAPTPLPTQKPSATRSSSQEVAKVRSGNDKKLSLAPTSLHQARMTTAAYSRHPPLALPLITCAEVEVSIPHHWRRGRSLPVLISVASGSPVSSIALVEMWVQESRADQASYQPEAITSCHAVLYRGRGSCLLLPPADQDARDDGNAAEQVAWIAVSDGGENNSAFGQPRAHPFANSTGPDGAARRQSTSWHHAPPAMPSTSVSFQNGALVCPTSFKPSLLRPMGLPEARGYAGELKQNVRVVSSSVIVGREVWGPNQEIVVLSATLRIGAAAGSAAGAAELRVENSSSLTILEGCTVYLVPNAEIVVENGASLNVYGDRLNPVAFLPANIPKNRPSQQELLGQQGSRAAGGIWRDASWGELRVENGALAVVMHAIFSGGGASTELSKVFGHSGSQPVLRAMTLDTRKTGGASPRLTVIGGAVVDCLGKALASSDAVVTLRGVLISRVDSGGEHRRSTVTMQRCHVVEIPCLVTSTSGRCVDLTRGGGSSKDGGGSGEPDDNDGVYFKGVYSLPGSVNAHRRQQQHVGSVVQDCTFAHGADDAIDVNGAVVSVDRTVINGFTHEGIAASGPANPASVVTVRDSLVRRCDQGIEAGYGFPQVSCLRVVVEECGVAFRFGDSYNWKYAGFLSIELSAALASSRHGLWDFVWEKPFSALSAGAVRHAKAALTARAGVEEEEWGGKEEDLTDAGVVVGSPRAAQERFQEHVEKAVRGGRPSGAIAVSCSVNLDHRRVIAANKDGISYKEDRRHCLDFITTTEDYENDSDNSIHHWLLGHLSSILGGPKSLNSSNVLLPPRQFPGMEPPFVHDDCPFEDEEGDGDDSASIAVSPKKVHSSGSINSHEGGGFSAAMKAASGGWAAAGGSQWSGKGWMKDTFPVVLNAGSKENPYGGASRGGGEEEKEEKEALVYARVKKHFLDRFERQYSFAGGLPWGKYKNWHELPPESRSLVDLQPTTSELFRPTLELLSHLRHRNVARILHMCGPKKNKNEIGSSRQEGLREAGHMETTTADNGRTDLSLWASKRGYDFTFAQEMAQGVPINRKGVAPPPPPKNSATAETAAAATAGTGTADTPAPSSFPPAPPHTGPAFRSAEDAAALAQVDLAIELASAVAALHDSPVGCVVHGDLKWSNIIAHPTQPKLQLIDFDNAVVFPSASQSMPASAIAFCCDMGRGHNHLAPECQKCQRVGSPMDVYVMGQRLLNFFDNQRINVFKQVGCVTSIYDKRLHAAAASAASAAGSNHSRQGTAAGSNNDKTQEQSLVDPANNISTNAAAAAAAGGGVADEGAASPAAAMPPCDPFTGAELPLRSLLRNEAKIDSAFPGVAELMASCLRLDPAKRPTMRGVLESLLASRTRMEAQRVTRHRLSAWEGKTGVPAQPTPRLNFKQRAALKTKSASSSSSPSPLPSPPPSPPLGSAFFFNVKSRDGSEGLSAWRSLLQAPLLSSELSAALLEDDGNAEAVDRPTPPLLASALLSALERSQKASGRRSGSSRSQAGEGSSTVPRRSQRSFPFAVVPGTVQVYSHSFLQGAKADTWAKLQQTQPRAAFSSGPGTGEAGVHGCGVRFVAHASFPAHSPPANKKKKKANAKMGLFTQEKQHDEFSSPWVPFARQEMGGQRQQQQRHDRDPRGGGVRNGARGEEEEEAATAERDAETARLMVKAVHSDNGHFDDESLYSEVKLFALDQLLSTALALPCVGARVDLTSPGLALVAHALAPKNKVKSKNQNQNSGLDFTKVSCLRPRPMSASTSSSSPTRNSDGASGGPNSTAHSGLFVDAAVCLFLDRVPRVKAQRITAAASDAVAADAAAHSARGGGDDDGGAGHPRGSSSSSSSSGSSLRGGGSGGGDNAKQKKPKKVSVPAALAAAEAYDTTPTTRSPPPSSSSRMLQGTRTPSFYADEPSQVPPPLPPLSALASSSQSSPSSSSSSPPVKNKPHFSPSHANVVPYALLSFLANCAKSSHNHFALQPQATTKSGGGGGGKELPSLVMIDNDRCFVPNAVLSAFTLSEEPAGPQAAAVGDASPVSSSSLSLESNKGSPEHSSPTIPPEHLERFTRWRRMLWATCSWLGPAFGDAFGQPSGGGGGGDDGGASGGGGGDDGAGVGEGVGNSVEDVLARLRWHSRLENPSLGQSLQSLLEEDALADVLLPASSGRVKGRGHGKDKNRGSTAAAAAAAATAAAATSSGEFVGSKVEGWATEMDSRVRELLTRVDQCVDERAIQELHANNGQGRQHQHRLRSHPSQRNEEAGDDKGRHPNGQGSSSGSVSEEFLLDQTESKMSPEVRWRCRANGGRANIEVCDDRSPVLGAGALQ